MCVEPRDCHTACRTKGSTNGSEQVLTVFPAMSNVSDKGLSEGDSREEDLTTWVQSAVYYPGVPDETETSGRRWFAVRFRMRIILRKRARASAHNVNALTLTWSGVSRKPKS